MTCRRVVGVLLMLWLTSGAPAEAACPDVAGAQGAFSSRTNTERFAFVQSHLAHEARATRTWTWVWFGINGAVSVGSFATLPLTPRHLRPENVVGAIASALSAATYFVFPVSVDAPVNPTQADAPSCEELARAEQALVTGAASETFGRSAFSHILVFSLAAVPGLVLGLGYHDWTGAALLFGVGAALGEVGIWTQPTGVIAALDDYRAGRLGRVAGASVRWNVAPFVISRGGGVSAGIQF